MKKAFITGITGQDGSYLAELLLEKGYEVYGLYRRTSVDVFERIGNIRRDIHLVEGDMTDLASLVRIIREVQPDEVYNLAAQSFVAGSWTQPVSTSEITAIGVLNILEAIRQTNPKIRFYQASSSEMYGKVHDSKQNEQSYFHPRSPYAVSKLYGYWITVNYRESYGMHTSNGILFNHESPRRGKQFVTRKITYSIAKIKLGLQDHFELGNLDAKRDWGYALDYVKAMWLMLQQEEPSDYVIATGETHSVREFVEAAFEAAAMKITWEGKGLEEVGKHNGKIVVRVNPKFYRPAEVDLLLGDITKAKQKLNWQPTVSFKGLVKMMMEADMKLVKKENQIGIVGDRT
jgi:GDPmannose 4,6-dehydratase